MGLEGKSDQREPTPQRNSSSPAEVVTFLSDATSPSTLSDLASPFLKHTAAITHAPHTTKVMFCVSQTEQQPQSSSWCPKSPLQH